MKGLASLMRVTSFAIAAVTAACADAQTEKASPAAAVGLPTVPTIRVLAIGRLTATATPEALRAFLPHEVQETVRLQLAGKIDQWFTRQDRPGVVFVIDTSEVSEARRLVDGLAFGRAGLMEFELIPLGPLAPLGLLLDREPR